MVSAGSPVVPRDIEASSASVPYCELPGRAQIDVRIDLRSVYNVMLVVSQYLLVMLCVASDSSSVLGILVCVW